MHQMVNKAEIWQEQDEQGFTFDIDAGVVFWHKHQVDMMAICDTCLTSVHQAACSDTRFIEFYHIPATSRLDHIQSIKDRELARAKLVGRLSVERTRRRAREFAIKVLTIQRHGMQQEKQKELEYQQLQVEERKERERNRALVELMKAAEIKDKKWKLNQIRENSILLHQIVGKAGTIGHYKYDRAHPVSREREHVYSWKLAPFDEDGLPVDSSASAEYFGRDNLKTSENLSQLQEWKKEAREIDAELNQIKREEERERERRRERERNIIK